MVSTKAVESTVAGIDAKLKTFGGDMVKIEFLENCLKQLGLANDAKRFAHLKLAELYAYKLMWPLAAKNMESAADCATTYKDKIDFYMKEIGFLLKVNDFLMLDKAAKKALMCTNNNVEKQAIKDKIKKDILDLAQSYESKNKRSNAAQLYERLIEMPITNETEKRELMGKVASLNSKLGKIKEAIRYEQMMSRPIETRKSMDPDENIRRISFEDLGIDSV
jgi:tetratricopeptide (TPR) repeat protein